MSKYLKLFDTTSQYNAYTADTANFIKPNVSFIEETNGVAYNALVVPPAPSHDYVEIGGVKWATMNIGANSVTDTGLYFQWGDTQGYTADQVGDGEGQKYFGWDDYKWTEDGGTTFTKYNSTDGKTILESSDDAVTAAWGSGWRMPTTAEFRALGNAVNTAWTQVDGVYGVLCTDKTDSSKTLFFPACGVCIYGDVYTEGSGAYWSSSLNSSEVQKAYSLYYDEDSSVYWDIDRNYRRYGFTVRGVLG